jgi:sec-independent protein translocase protein TatB
MFDIGFWELALIGAIALLVVGPERLPGLARTVGMWVGRIRRYVSHVKQDIERELHAEEVRQLLEKPEGLDGIRDVAKETASVFEDAGRARLRWSRRRPTTGPRQTLG